MIQIWESEIGAVWDVKACFIVLPPRRYHFNVRNIFYIISITVDHPLFLGHELLRVLLPPPPQGNFLDYVCLKA